MSQSRILVVHPDPQALSLLLSMLKTLGHALAASDSDREAVRAVDREKAGLVVAGVNPDEEGCLGLLAYLRRNHRETPVILLFSARHPERAREAMRLGASAVLKYPVPATDLRAAVLQELGAASPGQDGAGGSGRAPEWPPDGPRRTGRDAVGASASDPEIVGADPCVRQAVELAAAIAPTRISVLIVGERGTGKTLLAKAVHRRAGPDGRPFVTLDCGDPSADFAALWPARLAQARGGTLYLDKVGALPAESQAMLLDLLGDGRSAPPVSADAPRVVVSNDEGLAQLVALRRFRQDLFYRINGVCLNLPPLRHRGVDVQRLAEFFRARAAEASGKNVAGFSREAQALIGQYAWPGNVGELEAMVHAAVARCAGRMVFAKDLWPGRRRVAAEGRFGPSTVPPSGLRPLDVSLAESEKQIISESLQALRWNRQETARRLNINRTTLYKKMKKHGLLKIDDLFDFDTREAEGRPAVGVRGA